MPSDTPVGDSVSTQVGPDERERLAKLCDEQSDNYVHESEVWPEDVWHQQRASDWRTIARLLRGSHE
jgi:hypothetical protein